MKKQVLGYLTGLMNIEIENMVADESIYIKRIVDLQEENAKLKEDARWVENFKVMAKNLCSEKITYDQMEIERDYQFKENTRLKNANANLIRKISKYRSGRIRNQLYINELEVDIAKLRGPHWVD